MTRRGRAAGIALLVTGLAAGACGGGDSSGETTATTVAAATTTSGAPAATTTTTGAAVSTTVASKATVTDAVLRGGGEAERYTYEVTFPELTGLADDGVQQSVNTTTREEVTTAIDDFVRQVNEFGPSPVAGPLSGLRAEHQVDRLDDSLLSFRLPLSRFFEGSAHPATVLLTFTYDLRTGKRLALADLFTPGAPYLDSLSEQSRQLLLAQPGFDELPDFVNPGTEPRAENFTGWTVTDQDLVITFPEYQVAPYAMGMPRVSIPFASLRTLLDPAGPLAIHN